MHATYPHRSTLRVLPPSWKLGGVSSTPVFDHLGAASWHRGDAAFIKFLGSLAESFGVITVILAICCLLTFAVVSFWRARIRRAEWELSDKYVSLHEFSGEDAASASRAAV